MAPVPASARIPRRQCLAWLSALAILAAAALPASAQQAPGPAPAQQPENVRVEYAQVLRAEPVYQTLRATSMVERCEASTPVEEPEPQKTGFARVLGRAPGFGGSRAWSWRWWTPQTRPRRQTCTA